MCGRFTLGTERARIAEMFRLQRLGQFDPRYNIAPSQPVLAVRQDAATNELEGIFLKVGPHTFVGQGARHREQSRQCPSRHDSHKAGLPLCVQKAAVSRCCRWIL